MNKISLLLTKLQTGLTVILIFIIPTNLFFKLTEQAAYVDGLLIDYLIPKIYLQDIVILLTLLTTVIKFLLSERKDLKLKTHLKQVLNWLKSHPIIPILLLLFFVRQLVAFNQTASTWSLVRLIMLAGWFIWFKRNQKPTKNSVIYWPLLFSLAFQTALTGFQLLTQEQLVGYLFLGEPDLTQPFGLAQGTLFNRQIVLPYGTSAHPNLLAGWSLIAWWVIQTKTETIFRHNHWQKIFILISTIFHILILIATQSISAILATALGLILLIIKKSQTSLSQLKLLGTILILVLGPIGLTLIGGKVIHPSISRRNNLNQASLAMIADQPLLGIGLNNFTVKLESYATNPEIIRFVQPVHHFVLLWAAETGFLGILILILLIDLLRKTTAKTKLLNLLLLLAPILALDHYLLTIISGQLSLMLGVLATSESPQASP